MASGRNSLRPDSPVDARRRSVILKQSHFTQKHGKRHHAFDREKAPYPLSYDKGAIDLDIMDHLFLTQLKETVSFVDFHGDTPKRSLDLGCGTGFWVFDAAKEWPDCEFVGFDLVNIQPPLNAIDPAMASRVKWVHGNFLTTKLPFDDDEFDHVHIRGIARAVPENKWGYLFEEVSRVLRLGGVIEMIEEDIRFPTLPRWYTASLRAQNQDLPSIHLPDGVSRSAPPSSPPSSPPIELPHDHALLESLYYSVFESRFINLEPTSILPSYFSTYFRHVLRSPVINFPMPPLPHIPTYNVIASNRLSKITDSGFAVSSHARNKSGSSTSRSSGSLTEDELDAMHPKTSPTSASESESHCIHYSQESLTPVQPYYSSPSDDTSIGYAAEMALLPINSLSTATGIALALHLHRTYNAVLACQESMWEELKDRIRNREEQLLKLGWNDDDLEGHQSRSRFEKLLERYQGDMQARAALWQSVASSLSWKVPSREPRSKAETLEEERLRQAMLKARETAPDQESQAPCRTLRIFVGYKASL